MRFILIAAKQLEFAKTRLAPALPPGERRALAEAMFRDVLAASMGAAAADHVAVVTSDAGLLAMARSAGALTIDEEFPRGLNAAVALSTSALIAQGAETVCTVLSDIPLTAAEDIDAVFAAMPSGRRRGAGPLARFLRHQHYLPLTRRRRAHSIRSNEPGPASGRLPQRRHSG